VLTAQAAVDLSCEPDRLRATRVATPTHATRVFRVDACSRAALYAELGPEYSSTCAMQSPPPLVLGLGWVRLDGTDEAPELARIEALHRSGLDFHGQVARAYLALVTQAAADLTCPRDAIVPRFLPGGKRGRFADDPIPTAEGCGRRARYHRASAAAKPDGSRPTYTLVGVEAIE
jgi:hypothetical protein